MSTELQVLIRAREMVASGWVKGSAYSHGKTHRCAGQAITDAYLEVTGRPASNPPCMCGMCNNHSPWDGFNRVVEDFTVIIGYPSIPAWNDHPARTHGEVLRAFDDAIARLQQREEVTVAETPKVNITIEPIDVGDVWVASDLPANASYFQKFKELVGV